MANITHFVIRRWWLHYVADANALLVLSVVASCPDGEYRQGLQPLMELTGATRRTTLRHIATLRAAGMIEPAGEMRDRVYRLTSAMRSGLMERLAEAARCAKNGTMQSAKNGTMQSAKNGTTKVPKLALCGAKIGTYTYIPTYTNGDTNVNNAPFFEQKNDEKKEVEDTRSGVLLEAWMTAYRQATGTEYRYKGSTTDDLNKLVQVLNGLALEGRQDGTPVSTEESAQLLHDFVLHAWSVADRWERDNFDLQMLYRHFQPIYLRIRQKAQQNEHFNLSQQELDDLYGGEF